MHGKYNDCHHRKTTRTFIYTKSKKNRETFLYTTKIKHHLSRFNYSERNLIYNFVFATHTNHSKR